MKECKLCAKGSTPEKKVAVSKAVAGTGGYGQAGISVVVIINMCL